MKTPPKNLQAKSNSDSGHQFGSPYRASDANFSIYFGDKQKESGAQNSEL